MLAAGDTDFGRAGYRVESTWAQRSPRLVALASTLARLIAASDGVTVALTHHDRPALELANAIAESLVAEVRELAASLTDDDRADLDAAGIVELRRRLAVAARRNAYLIERAWASDAALMRLLLGLGRITAEGNLGNYAENPGPTYVDRGA